MVMLGEGRGQGGWRGPPSAVSLGGPGGRSWRSQRPPEGGSRGRSRTALAAALSRRAACAGNLLSRAEAARGCPKHSFGRLPRPRLAASRSSLRLLLGTAPGRAGSHQGPTVIGHAASELSKMIKLNVANGHCVSNTLVHFGGQFPDWGCRTQLGATNLCNLGPIKPCPPDWPHSGGPAGPNSPCPPGWV